MTTHEDALKSAKQAVSKILQGKKGCFYIAKTAGKREPDWLFIASGASEATAQTALVNAVGEADGLGAHRASCGTVRVSRKKLTFEIGAVKSLKPKLSAGQSRTSLRSLKSEKGMSFLGKVTISAAAGTVEDDDGNLITTKEVARGEDGGELTETEMVGIFVDDGVPLVAAQELVQKRTALIWDLRKMTAFDLDIFKPGSVVEVGLVAIQEELDMYDEADEVLEEDHRALYLQHCEATNAFLRGSRDGVFVHLSRCRYRKQKLLLAGASLAELEAAARVFLEESGTIRSCRFTTHAEDARYILLEADLVEPIQKALTLQQSPRVVLYAEGFDAAEDDVVEAALEERKGKRIVEVFKDTSVDTVLRPGPLRDMVVAYAEKQSAGENIAFIDDIGRFKQSLESGDDVDVDEIFDRLLSVGTDTAINIKSTTRLEIQAYRDAIAAGTATLDQKTLRRMIDKAAAEISKLIKNNLLSRFERDIVRSYTRLTGARSELDRCRDELRLAGKTDEEIRKHSDYVTRRSQVAQLYSSLGDFQRVAASLRLPAPTLPTWESVSHL